MIWYKFFKLGLVVFLFLAGVACQFVAGEANDKAADVPDESKLSPVRPSSVKVRENVSLVTEEPSVVPSGGKPVLLETKEDLIRWLGDVGVKHNPVHVQNLLLETGWIAQAKDWQLLDLDGDEQLEGVLTLIEKPEVEFEPQLLWSSVLLFDDEVTSFEGFTERETLYRVLSTSDLTGDQLPDIVVESATYGANYYPLTYHVLSTHHGVLQDIVRPPPDVNESYSSDEGLFISMSVELWEDAKFVDMTEDGLQDIVLKGIGGGGVGGGVSRSYQAVWGWDGEAITLTDVEWQADRYRFHRLYKANEAFEQGDDKTAYQFYHHVLFDELLSDDVSASCLYDKESETCKREPWTEPQTLYETNRQVAAFHLTLLALLRAEREGNTKTWRSEATYWRDWLQQHYPDTPLSQASHVLLSEWDATEDLSKSCQAVRTHLYEEYERDEKVFGALTNMGYNNPALTIEQLCIIPPQTDDVKNEKSTIVSELESIILPTLLSASPKQGYIAGNEHLNIIPLVGKDTNNANNEERPLWAVFTTGSVSDYPTMEHMLAIYTRRNDKWEEITSITFSEPTYLEASSVRQIQVTPDEIWLELFGGVGSDSSQYKVLRFDGQQLHVEIDHLRSRHGGFDLSPIDLDGDGMLELILEPLENYVFCRRECDVRYYKFLVLRWNGEAFSEIPLTTLQSSAPTELRDVNDHAVALAKAGLWKDALKTIREARAIDYTGDNAYVTWNELIIALHAEAMFRHTLDNGPNNYPLLANILYGDYDNALNMMQRFSLEKLFNVECPLIINTFVQGWQKELNSWIMKTTEKAFSMQPDLAAAYFLRAWSTYLIDPKSKEVLLDLEKAVELDPNERLFINALEYLKSQK